MFLTTAALFVWRVTAGHGGAAIVLFRACVFAWFAMVVFGRRVLSLRYRAALDAVPEARAFAARTRRLALAGLALFVVGIGGGGGSPSRCIPRRSAGSANLIPASGAVIALLGVALIAYWLMGRSRILALLMNSNATDAAGTLARQTRMQFLLMLGRDAAAGLIIYVALTLYPGIKSNITGLAGSLIVTFVLFQLSMRTYSRRAIYAGSPGQSRRLRTDGADVVGCADSLVLAAIAWVEIALAVLGIDTVRN